MGVRNEAPMWDDIVGLTTMETSDGLTFHLAVQELQRLKTLKAQVDASEKNLAEEIEAMLTATNQKRVRWGDKYCIERANGRSAAKIDPKLLVTKGVSTEIIAESTVPGKPYTYVQFLDLTKNSGGKGSGAGKGGDASDNEEYPHETSE